ncbi:MAG: hypothetical protein NTX53_08610 [candidate division WOR-3 bacterium]|nr:hypothetical protein [candidate division WOR-3 bacterium]
MRYVARALLLAAVLLVAGCSLFRDRTVQVARITSIAAPDTVVADSTFSAIVTAMLGPDSGYVLDRFEVSGTDAQVTVQAWSRDTSNGKVAPLGATYSDVKIGAKPTEPGKFSIIALKPDGSTTLKTITVLP